jgi:hypothetical protein
MIFSLPSFLIQRDCRWRIEGLAPRPRHPIFSSKTSSWEFEMEDQIAVSLAFDQIVEILPPEPDQHCLDETRACLCCGRRSWTDEDGCGICEECLYP